VKKGNFSAGGQTLWMKSSSVIILLVHELIP
jgi:hypothetical protein